MAAPTGGVDRGCEGVAGGEPGARRRDQAGLPPALRREVELQSGGTSDAIRESNQRLDRCDQPACRGPRQRPRRESRRNSGVINANLEGRQGPDWIAPLAVAKWTVTAAAPILLGIAYWSYSNTDRSARLESSVMVLRDRSNSPHDEQISKILDMPP